MSSFNLSTFNILVAEENPFNLGILRQHLRSFGAEKVLEAEDGAHAYDLICENSIDIALVDCDLAPVSGLDFVKQIRTHPESPNAELPIIILVENASVARLTAARDAGATEILTKPLAASTLISRIQNALKKSRAFVRADGFIGPDRRRRPPTHPEADRRSR